MHFKRGVATVNLGESVCCGSSFDQTDPKRRKAEEEPGKHRTILGSTLNLQRSCADNARNRKPGGSHDRIDERQAIIALALRRAIADPRRHGTRGRRALARLPQPCPSCRIRYGFRAL